MPRLSGIQQQRLEDFVRRNPDKAEEMFQRLEKRGFEVDRAEFDPVRISAELDAAVRGGITGLTLGAIDLPPAEGAGDIDLPFVGDVQPSRLIGEFAGMAIPGSGAFKGAEAATKGIGSTMLRRGAREALTGAALGAGEQVGNLAQGREFTLEAIPVYAAVGAAIGVIGGKLYDRFLKVVDKKAAGEVLTTAEKATEKRVADRVEQNLPDLEVARKVQRARVEPTGTPQEARAATVGAEAGLFPGDRVPAVIPEPGAVVSIGKAATMRKGLRALDAEARDLEQQITAAHKAMSAVKTEKVRTGDMSLMARQAQSELPRLEQRLKINHQNRLLLQDALENELRAPFRGVPEGPPQLPEGLPGPLGLPAGPPAGPAQLEANFSPFRGVEGLLGIEEGTGLKRLRRGVTGDQPPRAPGYEGADVIRVGGTQGLPAPGGPTQPTQLPSHQGSTIVLGNFDEHATKVASGKIKPATAIRRFTADLDKIPGIPYQQRQALISEARTNYLEIAAGRKIKATPATPDPPAEVTQTQIVEAPVRSTPAAPAGPAPASPKLQTLSVNQVLQGRLLTSEIERIRSLMGTPDTQHGKMSLGKFVHKGGGGMTLEEALEDALGNPEHAAILRGAGVRDAEDVEGLARVIAEPKKASQQHPVQLSDFVDEAFAAREIGIDTSFEGMSEQVRKARTPDELDEALELASAALDMGDMDVEEYTALLNLYQRRNARLMKVDELQAQRARGIEGVPGEVPGAAQGPSIVATADEVSQLTPEAVSAAQKLGARTIGEAKQVFDAAEAAIEGPRFANVPEEVLAKLRSLTEEEAMALRTLKIAGEGLPGGRFAEEVPTVSFSEETATLPGIGARELPRGPKKTSGSAREEGTPLFEKEPTVDAEPQSFLDSVEGRSSEETRSEVPSQTPQERGGTPKEDKLEGVARRQTPKAGNAVVVTLNDGKRRIGVLLPKDPDVPNTVQIMQGNRKVYLDPSEITSIEKMRFPSVSGGAPAAPREPATTGQVGFIYHLRDQLKKQSIDVDVHPSQLSKEQASAEIDHMQGLLGRQQVVHEEALLDDVGKIASEKKDGFEFVDEPVSQASLGDELGDAAEMGNPERYRDVSFLYAHNVVPEISRWGMGANPHSKAVLDRGLEMVEVVQRDIGAALEKLQAATRGLSREEKYRLALALDVDERHIQGFPQLQAPYEQLRSLTDEIAARLGLQPGQRVSQYFPHIFRGTLGRWRAIQAGEELGSSTARNWVRQAGAVDKIRGTEVEAGVPLQRFFQHVLPRKGVQGYDMDLDKVMYSYLSGAIRKAEMDPYLEFAVNQLKEIPTRDLKGRPMAVRSFLAEHIAHVAGQPQRARTTMAKFWGDSSVFNAGVDWMVEAIGGAPEKGLLGKARRLGELNDKLVRGTLTQAERVERDQIAPAQALEWLDEMIRTSRRYIEGIKSTEPRMKRYRAATALAIDDMRAAMADPFRKGFLAQQAYRWMVIAKLGGNFAHGIINMTQFLTNTVPVLDAKYAARGVRNVFADPESPLLGGHTIRSVLDESGIRADIGKAGEFFERRFGLTDKLQKWAMMPSALSEQFLRQSSYMGAYEQSLARQGVTGTASEAEHQAARKFALDIMTKTQFPFNRVGTPKIMRHPGVRLLLMFQSYPIHQMNFSAELIAQATKGDVAPLVKHALAYFSLAGAGAAVGNNFWARTQHPALDITDMWTEDDNRYQRDIMDLFSGPPAAALLQASKGNFDSALRELQPSVIRRAQSAKGSTFDQLEDLLLGNLLEDRKEKGRRALGGIGGVGAIRGVGQ